MPQVTTRTRLGKRREKAKVLELSKYLNSLVASIHDQTFDNNLNVGQIAIVREHLYYALVVGWENNQKNR